MRSLFYTAFVLIGLLLLPGPLSAGAPPDSIPVDERLTILHDCVTYDSVIASWREANSNRFFENFTQDYVNLDTTNRNYTESVTPFTDEEYRSRLQRITSPIHLPYNQVVRKYIVAYVTTHRALTRRMLGESQYYFPLIECELERVGLPLELKFLPVIESALRPTATSSSGHVGLWQLSLNAARQYGLEVSSMVDQRRDPIASTRAACAYLKDLYNIYGDWSLAIASYNYGPGNVNKALRRAGGKASTYWNIYSYLPSVTRNYIPALIGLTYAYYYYKEYHILPDAPTLPLATDTVTIRQYLHLGQVSSILGIPMELLRALNPQYKQDIIPATVHDYPLVLPQREISHFLEHEEEIYGQDSTHLADRPILGDQSTQPTVTLYKVCKGDTLGAIAAKYGVTIAQLKEWNHLKSVNSLQIGQTLKVSRL